MKRFSNINPLYLILILILAVPTLYVGFKQLTVITCNESASKYVKERTELFIEKNGRKPMATQVEFTKEKHYMECMRDKGFSV